MNIHSGSDAMKTLRRTMPMGEKQNGPIQYSFNASLKLDFQGLWVTPDGGLILVPELGERQGFSELIGQPAAAGLTLGGRTRNCSWSKAHA
jgi:hypothetical protein